MKSISKHVKKLLHKKSYRLILISCLILGLTSVVAGIVGLQMILYIDSGTTIEKDVIVYSNYDNSPMYLNYLTPSEDIKTDVGVILAHGFTSNRWGFQPFATALVDAGLQVAVFDERGHGDTWGFMKDKIGWEGQNLIERSAQAQGDLLAIRNFLESRGAKHFIVIGHSMGGINSFWFSSKYPSKVDATIVIGAAGQDMSGFSNVTSPPNLLMIMGKNEELFSVTQGLLTLKEAVGHDVAENTFYGNFSKNTARKLEIIAGIGLRGQETYTGHIQEITTPETFISTLNWIKSVGIAKGYAINYDSTKNASIIEKNNLLGRFESLPGLGFFLLFIPLVIVISTFAIQTKPKSQQKFEAIMKDFDFSPWKKWFLISMAGSFSALAFAYLSNSLSLFYWLFIKYSNFIVGTVIGFGLIWTLFFYLTLYRKSPFSKFKSDSEIEINRKNLIINILIGIIFGFYNAVMNFFLLNSFGLSSTIGSLPLNPHGWLLWGVYALILLIIIIPEEIYIRAYQESLDKLGFMKTFKKIGFRNLWVKLPTCIIIGMVIFMVPLDLMFIFTIATFAVLALLELLSTFLYQACRSVVVTIVFNTISLSWFITSMLPFVY